MRDWPLPNAEMRRWSMQRCHVVVITMPCASRRCHSTSARKGLAARCLIAVQNASDVRFRFRYTVLLLGVCDCIEEDSLCCRQPHSQLALQHSMLWDRGAGHAQQSQSSFCLIQGLEHFPSAAVFVSQAAERLLSAVQLINIMPPSLIPGQLERGKQSKRITEKVGNSLDW